MKKIIIAVTSLAIIFSVTFIIFKQKKSIKESEQITVKTCRAEFENIYSDIESYGTVFYKTKTDITCLVPGNIISKNCKEGDYVQKGQILYILKNVQLEIEHSQNQNSLNSAFSNLELYKAKLDEKEKEVISRLISISNLEAEIEMAKNNLAISKDKLEKSIELNKLGGVTDQELIEMKNQFENLKTELEIQKRELNITSMGFTKQDLIQNGITPAQDDEILKKQIIKLNTKTAVADLEVARTQYENAKASLLLTEKLLEDLNIKSPVTGIIGCTNFENGEYIQQNENIATIIDISTCVAEMNIQENNIYNISIGNRAKIEIPAAGKTIDTFITDISPVADKETGNFFVKADFKNSDDLIKPGMYLKCSISNNYHTKYLKIPETALLNTTEKSADCFIVKNDMAFLQKIQIDFIKNGYAFVGSGLTDKYQIINNPPKTIKDGTYVKVL